MSEIQRLHDETEKLRQESLSANLLFVAYLLDIARLELHRHLVPADAVVQRDALMQNALMQEDDHRLPKARLH